MTPELTQALLTMTEALRTAAETEAAQTCPRITQLQIWQAAPTAAAIAERYASGHFSPRTLRLIEQIEALDPDQMDRFEALVAAFFDETDPKVLEDNDPTTAPEAHTSAGPARKSRKPRRRKVVEVDEEVFVAAAGKAGLTELAASRLWKFVKENEDFNAALAAEGVPLFGVDGDGMSVDTVGAIVGHEKFTSKSWIKGLGPQLRKVFKAIKEMKA